MKEYEAPILREIGDLTRLTKHSAAGGPHSDLVYPEVDTDWFPEIWLPS